MMARFFKKKWENLDFFIEWENKKKLHSQKDPKQKIKIKRMITIFKKITNHNYGLKNGIENKSKFNKNDQ